MLFWTAKYSCAACTLIICSKTCSLFLFFRCIHVLMHITKDQVHNLMVSEALLSCQREQNITLVLNVVRGSGSNTVSETDGTKISYKSSSHLLTHLSLQLPDECYNSCHYDASSWFFSALVLTD